MRMSKWFCRAIIRCSFPPNVPQPGSVVVENSPGMREVGGLIPSRIRQKTLKFEFLLLCLVLMTKELETVWPARSWNNGLDWDITAYPWGGVSVGSHYKHWRVQYIHTNTYIHDFVHRSSHRALLTLFSSLWDQNNVIATLNPNHSLTPPNVNADYIHMLICNASITPKVN